MAAKSTHKANVCRLKDVIARRPDFVSALLEKSDQLLVQSPTLPEQWKDFAVTKGPGAAPRSELLLVPPRGNSCDAGAGCTGFAAGAESGAGAGAGAAGVAGNDTGVLMREVLPWCRCVCC